MVVVIGRGVVVVVRRVVVVVRRVVVVVVRGRVVVVVAAAVVVAVAVGRSPQASKYTAIQSKISASSLAWKPSVMRTRMAVCAVAYLAMLYSLVVRPKQSSALKLSNLRNLLPSDDTSISNLSYFSTLPTV